jgi:O-antigen/teichoic acid export membrane protein
VSLGLAQGDGGVTSLARRSVALLAAIGVAFGAAGYLGGPWLIERLYGDEFRGSTLPLQILCIAMPLRFVNLALTHFTVALGWQALNLLFNLVLFGLNVALCVAFIPRYGVAAAAGAVVICEVVLLALCTAVLYRRLGLR